MGHNFHVEWHFKFEVENCVKSWSTPVCTIHRHRENCKVGVQFMRNLLLKTPISLCRSCGGSDMRKFGIKTLVHFSSKFGENLGQLEPN
jgi:hypothetical protein